LLTRLPPLPVVGLKYITTIKKFKLQTTFTQGITVLLPVSSTIQNKLQRKRMKSNLIKCNPILTYLEAHPEFNRTDLAALFGISRVTLSRIIHRRQLPSPDTILKITEATDEEITHSALLECYSETLK
jgi:transcriptional regulator with XRE-family HTH domain